MGWPNETLDRWQARGGESPEAGANAVLTDVAYRDKTTITLATDRYSYSSTRKYDYQPPSGTMTNPGGSGSTREYLDVLRQLMSILYDVHGQTAIDGIARDHPNEVTRSIAAGRGWTHGRRK